MELIEALVQQRNNSVLIFSIKFCLSLHYNADNIYLLVNGKETIKFKADNEMLTFRLDFV